MSETSDSKHDLPYADYMEESADKMEANAKLPKDMTKRLRDAPGWSLKMARKIRNYAHKKRKAYEYKQIQLAKRKLEEERKHEPA